MKGDTCHAPGGTDGHQPPPTYQSHPLGPLSGDEILQSSSLIKSTWPPGADCQFKVISLLEPAKAELIPYLAAERTGQADESTGLIDRRAFVVYHCWGQHNMHEAVVNLSTGKVESNARLGPFLHPNAGPEEIVAVEKAALGHADVQAAIAKLQLPHGTQLVLDPWTYGSDGIKDERRLMQLYMYMRDPNKPEAADSCHYAFPLPISPVMDPVSLELVRIDVLPTGHDDKTRPLAAWEPTPPNEYVPEAQPALRTDLKPLRVIQPQGASFSVEPFSELGRLVKWQKWDFKLGFNQREGPILYDVHYDDKPLFYRVSLSDMMIPYADPRAPFHRKAAFDLGDAGAGTMANSLRLGCDCLGSIYYMAGVLADAQGRPKPLPNAVCVHEQDAGIGWKHTNYRTGRAVVTRQRELIVQTITTVANYEYVLAFVFTTAGDMDYEVRATGVLSTQPVDLCLTQKPHPYGTVVHPGVLAAHHQHLFSLRVDPMIAGHGNTIVYDEAVRLPRDGATNPHGVAYTVRRTELAVSGGHNLSPSTNRTFLIINPSVRNPINAAPVAYKIVPPPMQPLLADPDSFHSRRGAFADRSFYVTRYAERELYAGGLYTNQSRGGDGVRAWAARCDSLRAGNPVVWVQFGINHIPRVEDFPVMPVETIRVHFRPVNFFARNPAIDVPSSEQEENYSVGLNEQMDRCSLGAEDGQFKGDVAKGRGSVGYV